MSGNLLRLLKHTFVYSGGQLFSKLINFCLLPLTTQYLTPQDYGILGSLAIGAQLLAGLFSLGFGVSLSRCFFATEKEDEKNSIIWTGSLVLLLHSLILFSLLWIFSPQVGLILSGNANYSYYVNLIFLTLVLSTISLPCQTWIRIKEKSVTAVSIAGIEVLISTAATLYLVIYQGLGARGMLEGGLIGQLTGFALLLGIMIYQVPFSIKTTFIKDMISVGSPYIAGSFGILLMQCSPRYILQSEWGLKEVGLLFMAMNFAKLIETIVSGFISAWPPFSMSFLQKQEEAKFLFGKVLRYFLLLMFPLLMFYFVGAKWIVKVMLHPNFHAVWIILGLQATVQFLYGVYSILAVPLIFKRKTLWQAGIEFAGGAVCLICGYLLIGPFAKLGASLAMACGYLFLVILTASLCRKLLKVQYEPQVFHIIFLIVAMASLSFIEFQNQMYNLFYSLGLMLLSMYLLFVYGLEKSEQQKFLSFKYYLVKT